MLKNISSGFLNTVWTWYLKTFIYEGVYMKNQKTRLLLLTGMNYKSQNVVAAINSGNS